MKYTIAPSALLLSIAALALHLATSAFAEPDIPEPWLHLTSLSDAQQTHIRTIVARSKTALEAQNADMILKRTRELQRTGLTNLLSKDIEVWKQINRTTSRKLERAEIMSVLSPLQRMEANALWAGFTLTATVGDFQPFKAKQRNALWCWAASIAMVLEYNGIPSDQETVAQEIKGTSDAWSKATAEEVQEALTRSKISKDPRKTWLSTSRYQHGAPNPILMIPALEWGRPVLAAIEDVHVVVVHKVAYRENADSSQRRIQSIVIYDPLQDKDEELQWEDAAKLVTDVWYPQVSTYNSGRLY